MIYSIYLKQIHTSDIEQNHEISKFFKKIKFVNNFLPSPISGNYFP